MIIVSMSHSVRQKFQPPSDFEAARLTPETGGGKVMPSTLIVESMRSLAAIALCASLLAGGCVERKLRVETAPPGAEIWLDGVHLGQTPVEIPFTFYGARQVRLEKSGYATEIMPFKASPPPYEWFPVDFISENLIPARWVDRHTLRVELTPQPPLTEAEKNELERGLQERAAALREHLADD